MRIEALINEQAGDAALRDLNFEGTRNFRDLGGIPTPAGATRRGVIYRSDRLCNLTDADHARLQELHIATVIDMRAADECERAPNRLPENPGLRQVSRPFLPRQTRQMFDAINAREYDADAAYAMMLKQYKTLTLEHAADYGRIIDDLLEPQTVPAVIHCTSGKDRTGMVAAILLLAVDAPVGAITADYMMTQDRIEKVDYFADTADPRAVDVVMAARPEYLHAAMAAMESEFGSVRLYLRDGVGITPEKRRGLRALLVGT